MVCSDFNKWEGLKGTYELIINKEGGIGQRSAYGRDVVALTT